jgi:hypothetical protein
MRSVSFDVRELVPFTFSREEEEQKDKHDGMIRIIEEME